MSLYLNYGVEIERGPFVLSLLGLRIIAEALISALRFLIVKTLC